MLIYHPISSGILYRQRNRLLRLVEGFPVSVLAGGAAVEEDEMTSELSVVETGGDAVGNPKTAIA